MTVGQLKKTLEGVPDETLVEVPVYTFTKAHPTYARTVEVKEGGTFEYAAGRFGVRQTFCLFAHLPEGVQLHDRRK